MSFIISSSLEMGLLPQTADTDGTTLLTFGKINLIRYCNLYVSCWQVSVNFPINSMLQFSSKTLIKVCVNNLNTIIVAFNRVFYLHLL